MKKSKRPTFEEVVFDATFKVVGAGDMPKGEHFWCSFCGGRGIHFVLLERNDGQAFKVGRTCLGRVGLELPKSVKKVTIRRIGIEKKKAEEVKKPEKVEEKKPEKVEKKTGKIEKKKPDQVSKEKETSPEDIEDLFEDL